MNNNILAERLKNMRKENNITQVELAKKIGVAKSVVAGAETKRGISKTLAAKLAEFFNTDIDYWINENADKELIKEMPFLETTKIVMQRLLDEEILTLDNLDSIKSDKEIHDSIMQSLIFDAMMNLKKKEQN